MESDRFLIPNQYVWNMLCKDLTLADSLEPFKTKHFPYLWQT